MDRQIDRKRERTDRQIYLYLISYLLALLGLPVLPHLKLYMKCCKRFHSDQIVHDTGCIAVVGAVVELLYHPTGIFKCVISVDKLSYKMSIFMALSL